MSKTQFLSAPLRAVITTLLLALAGFGGAPRALAQATANPPERMTYQGYLVDGNGIPLATNAPKNYDVVFRIWSDASATAPASRLWTEQQTVTVDKGYFSVLLGEGSSISEPRPDLSTVFTGANASDRFMGLTVKGIGAGSPPGDVDILPRLRLLTSPYAFLARNAANLVSPSGSTLVTSSGNAVTVNGPIAATSFAGSGALLTGLTADQIPALDASKITAGTLAGALLPGNVALLDRNVQTFSGANVNFAGWVGIGTDSLVAPLTVYGIGGRNMTGRYFAKTLTGVDQVRYDYVSVKSEWYVEAFGFVAVSDQRIKDVVRRTEPGEDLRTIQKLQVTDYRMKDRVQNGNAVRKGFIAQEVRAVLPGAVSVGKGVIPNIYAKADGVEFDQGQQTLRVTLPAPHELKVGDTVRLFADEASHDLKVSAVPTSHSIVVGPLTTAPQQVFVYGKQVDDFLSVDYDRIFTTGIGAIQELAKRVEMLETRESHLAELEQKAARVEALEHEVADLKKMVGQLAEVAKAAKQTALGTPQHLSAAADGSQPGASSTTRLDR